MNVLPSTWAFKVKQFPEGMVWSLKAWICARGDCQIENVDFFDTFAPVGCWTTIWLMLVMVIKMKLSG